MLEVILRGEMIDNEGETRFVHIAVQPAEDGTGEQQVDFRLVDVADELKGNVVVGRDELLRALDFADRERALEQEPDDDG